MALVPLFPWETSSYIATVTSVCKASSVATLSLLGLHMDVSARVPMHLLDAVADLDGADVRARLRTRREARYPYAFRVAQVEAIERVEVVKGAPQVEALRRWVTANYDIVNRGDGDDG